MIKKISRKQHDTDTQQSISFQNGSVWYTRTNVVVRYNEITCAKCIPLFGRDSKVMFENVAISIKSKGKIIFVSDYFLLSTFITPHLLVCLLLVLTNSLFFFSCLWEALWAWCERVGRRAKVDDMLL